MLTGIYLVSLFIMSNLTQCRSVVLNWLFFRSSFFIGHYVTQHRIKIVYCTNVNKKIIKLHILLIVSIDFEESAEFCNLQSYKHDID